MEQQKNAAEVQHFIKQAAILMGDFGSSVNVELVPLTEGSTQLKMSVDPRDVGKIIGKSGRIARALRELLVAVSGATGHRYSLDIVNPANVVSITPTPFIPNRNLNLN